MMTATPIPISTEKYNQTNDVPEYQIDGKCNIYKSDNRTGKKQLRQLDRWGYKTALYEGESDAASGEYVCVELYFFKTSDFDNILKEVGKVKKLLDPRKIEIQHLNISIIKFR